MPVDERTFAAEIAGWVTEYLGDNTDLPFARAAVEEHVEGTTRRHDFRLYHRQTLLPVLSVPPSLLATALLLQTYDKVSDAEAKARADFDHPVQGRPGD